MTQTPVGLCTCNHAQTHHGNTTNYTDRPNAWRIPGHGACVVGNCSCPQFTWKGWLRNPKSQILNP